MPSEAGCHLGETDIERPRARPARTEMLGQIHPHLTDDASVTILLVPFDPHVLAEDHSRERLLRALAEGQAASSQAHQSRRAALCMTGAIRRAP